MNQGSSGPGGFRGNGASAGDGSDRRQKVQELAEEASAQMEHAKVVFDDFNNRALQFIRHNPGVAVLGAVAVGYLFGKIAAKTK